MTNQKRTRREVLSSTASIALLSLLAPSLPARALDRRARSNIVFILADDLGYGDLGCTGSSAIRTPNIDRLAAEGASLRQAYANSPVCSASRVGLLTGRYQYRLPVGLDEPLPPKTPLGLPPGRPTLPSMLRSAGYRTSLIGKWHLGDPPKFGPLKSGYQRFFGVYGGGVDYFSHVLMIRGKATDSLYEGDKPVHREGYLTTLLGDRAVEEIDAYRGSEQPFFMSLHFTAPHWPWEGPEDEARSKTLSNSIDTAGGSLDTYRKMVEAMDREVGRVLDALDANGMADDTIVIFTSDNGGERYSNTWPFIGDKTELLEGGIHVASLIRWPRRIAPGQHVDQVTMLMDWVPTLLAATRTLPPAGYQSDGEDILPVLLGTTAARDRTLFWRYKAGNQAAVRAGHWKYLRMGKKEYLFDLGADPHERANRIDSDPVRAATLRSQWESWNAGMLPYGPENVSHSLADYIADRYTPSSDR